MSTDNVKDEMSYRKVDLRSAEYEEKFAQADEYVDLAPLVVEEITEEGLAEGRYQDKGVTKNANGNYTLVAYEMQTQKHNGAEVRALVAEDTYVVEPGMWIVTRPVNREGDPQTHFVVSDIEDVKDNYEEADRFDSLEGFSFGPELPRGVVVRPKGYMAGEIKPLKAILNDTGENVEVLNRRGRKQKGRKDCYFVKNGSACYLVSKDDFQSYMPYKKYLEQ